MGLNYYSTDVVFESWNEFLQLLYTNVNNNG